MRTIKTAFLVFFAASIYSCGQPDPNEQVDEGRVEENSYTSKEIGWTINIPENWTVVSREQNEENQEKGLEAMQDLVEGDIDISELKNLIGFQKNQFNSFISTSEPFELEYEGEWEYHNANIKELIYTTYSQEGIKADSSITEIVDIDGLKFHSYSFTIYNPDGEVVLNQIMYSRLINGFDFGVNINYNNESYKNEMLDAWMNSKFKKF